MDNYESTLQHSSLFANISIDQIRDILSKNAFKVRSYRMNEPVVLEGHPFNSMGIVLDGSVKGINTSSSGKCVILSIAKKSESFSVGLPFSKDRHSIIGIVAAEQTDLLLLDRFDLMHLFSENSMILNNYLEMMANGLHKFHQKVKLLSLKSIRQKICFYLLNESQTQQTTTIKLGLSKNSWAEYLGIPSPSLSRELRKMSMEGLIHVDKNIIELSDMDKLKSILF